MLSAADNEASVSEMGDTPKPPLKGRKNPLGNLKEE
jgi:hypothetical protein